MPSIYKRRRKDGKEASRWTVSYKGADGRYRTKVGYTDRTASLALGVRLETEAAQVRDGLLAPAELSRREATRRTLKDHVEDYRLHVLAKGGTHLHASQIAGALTRLLDDASVRRLGDLTPDRIQAALGRLRQKRSPRTVNHALGAVKAFANWLRDSDRIEGHKLKGIEPYSESIDRKRERRALTPDEAGRLIDATERGEPVRLNRRGYQYEERFISGPERAILYRLALGTGFRAEELRSLTRDSFRLDTTPPAIVCEAAATKNGRRAVQPIRPDLAALLRAWLPTRPESGPILPIPVRTAQLLRHDLAAAGIPYTDARGQTVDFHALRATFITHLIQSGANVREAQVLARHSTPTLTIGRYAKVDEGNLSAALGRLPAANGAPVQKDSDG